MSEHPYARQAGKPLPANLVSGQANQFINGAWVASALQPTNQGPIEVLWQSKGPEANQVSTTGFAQIQRRNAGDTVNEGITGTFEAPYTGEYLLVWFVSGIYATGSASTYYKMEVTGATTLTLNPQVPITTAHSRTEEWAIHAPGSSLRSDGQFLTKVTLNKGTNTFAPYWLHTNLGAAANNDELTRFEAVVLGMGGTATVHYNELKRQFHGTGPFTKTDGAYSSIESGVTNGDVTFPASGPFEFEIELNPYASGVAGVQFELSVGGSPVGVSGKHGITAGISNQCTVKIPHNAVAGNTTWEVKWRNTGGGGTLNLDANSFFRAVVRGGAAFNAVSDPDPPYLAAPPPGGIYLNDEFSSGTLDPAWTATGWTTGTVDPALRSTAGTHVYDLTTRDGWLLLQPQMTGGFPAISRAVTLPTNATVVCRYHPPSIFGSPPTNSLDFLLALNDGTSNNNVAVGTLAESPNHRSRGFHTVGGASQYDNRLSLARHFVEPWLLVIVKVGTTYYTYINGVFYGTATMGAAVTTLTLNLAAVDTGGSNRNPIHAVDFVRIYNTARFL
jgi:hypothetical protein